MPPRTLNAYWSQVLIERVCAAGVQHAVVCPGSRSSPLAMAIAQQAELKAWTVIDERSAGFFALGIAKQSGETVLLLSTSGTAAANFYPAVVEASMARIPLLVLTADRPWELRAWGAPQTVDQQQLFGAHVRWFLGLTEPENTLEAFRHLAASAARAVVTTQKTPKGPVHFNLPFRESAETAKDFSEQLGPSREIQWTPPTLSVNQALLESVAAMVRSVKKGIIVCGPRDADDQLPEALAALSVSLGYPLFAEAASQVRFGNSAAQVVSHYDLLLFSQAFSAAHSPELVLRFGGPITSKRLQQWLETAKGPTVLFNDQGALFDPGHRAGWILEGNAAEACRRLEKTAQRSPDSSWVNAFLSADRIAQALINLPNSSAEADQTLTEPQVAREVVAAMPARAQLFVSSSMPIRDVDAFAAARLQPLRVLANRGANGIDGIVSSALGVAAAVKGRDGPPTCLLLGDLALFHDLGGLLTACRHKLSMAIVVVNNDGGGIFSFLPIAHENQHFETFFATPHGRDFALLGKAFDAVYSAPKTADALRQSLAEAWKGGLHLIEVRTVRNRNVEIHQHLAARVASELEKEAMPC